MTTTINGIEELKAKVGEQLGYSDWHEITQEQVNLFADATGDHQWIHVDVERAKTGPFGGAIAHGYLTLSMTPVLLAETVNVEGVQFGVNYGLNKVRFPAPVLVGSKIRAGIKLLSCEEVQGGVQTVFEFSFEAEGQAKPPCVAEWVLRYYP